MRDTMPCGIPAVRDAVLDAIRDCSPDIKTDIDSTLDGIDALYKAGHVCAHSVHAVLAECRCGRSPGADVTEASPFLLQTWPG